MDFDWPEGKTEVISIDACVNCPAWSDSCECQLARRPVLVDTAHTKGVPDWCPLRTAARLLVLEKV